MSAFSEVSAARPAFASGAQGGSDPVVTPGENGGGQVVDLAAVQSVHTEGVGEVAGAVRRPPVTSSACSRSGCSRVHQPREHAVPCMWCGTPTTDVNGECARCRS